MYQLKSHFWMKWSTLNIVTAGPSLNLIPNHLHMQYCHRTQENSIGFRQFKKLSFDASLKKQASIHFSPSGFKINE